MGWDNTKHRKWDFSGITRTNGLSIGVGELNIGVGELNIGVGELPSDGVVDAADFNIWR